MPVSPGLLLRPEKACRLSAPFSIIPVALGIVASGMVALGYPGEISSSNTTRWIWWAAAMIPFLIIVFDLYVGLRDSIAKQPEGARSLVSTARRLLIVTWAFHPIVFILPVSEQLGFSGPAATVGIQVGYSPADILAKAAFGIFIYMIAVRKSQAESKDLPAGQREYAVAR